MADRQDSAGPAVGTAPGDLATLQAFVNTLDIEQGIDELPDPPALADWLVDAGLLEPDRAPATSVAGLRQALRLREALRAVLRSHTVRGQPDAAVAALNKIARSLRTRIEVSIDGQVRSAAAGEGVSEALASLLLIAAEAATMGTWTRLKVCSSDSCQWAFYDRSPTRNGCWCSMQLCGSRSKSRTYRRRAAALRASSKRNLVR
jgi:predicted RNA-binding Zn ribbon-like protein